MRELAQPPLATSAKQGLPKLEGSGSPLQQTPTRSHTGPRMPLEVHSSLKDVRSSIVGHSWLGLEPGLGLGQG